MEALLSIITHPVVTDMALTGLGGVLTFIFGKVGVNVIKEQRKRSVYYSSDR